MTKPEQIQVIGSALRQYNKWVSRRFIFALSILCVVFLPYAVLDSENSGLSWKAIFVYVLGGLVFWIYLLWEINFAVHAAVLKHLGEDKAVM